MLTYKCFFKIVKAHINTFLLYSSIFIVMAVVGGLFAGGQQGELVRTSINLGVVNRDVGHPVSQALISYLENSHNIVPLYDDVNSLTDSVFFFHVAYALIIEENFGENFAANNTGVLRHLTTPELVGINVLIGRQIDGFLQTIQGYLAAGFDYNQAIYLSKLDHENTVTVISSEEGGFLSLYFSSLTFITFTLVILSLSLTIMVFKEKDLANRLEVSPTPRKTRILWFTASGASLAYGMWALMLIPAHFLHHESLLSARGMLHMLNSFVLVTVCISIAILLTESTKNADVVVRVTTVLGIIASVTGGPFVNVETLHPVIQVVSRFFPAFWNAQGNGILFSDFVGTEVNMADFWMGIGVQIAFAAALFAVALVIGREKKQAEA